MLARFIQRLVLLIVVLLSVNIVQMQTAFADYIWETANMSIAYPRDWDAPVSTPGEPRSVLQLAQGFVNDSVSRPPAIPIITAIVSTEEIEDDALFDFLATAMQSVGIQAEGALPARWLELDAIAATGSNENGDLFGIGRIVRLEDGRVLLMFGRSGDVRRNDFTVTFDLVADSLVLSADREPRFPEYGVRWALEQLPSGGDDAFINLGALVLASDGTLYAADEVVGLIQIDATTGQILDTISFAEDILPSTLAVRPDGTVYVGDVLCQCVRVVRDGEQQQTLDNFGAGAPRSIAWLDGTFYATDQTDAGAISVLAVGDDRIRRITFDDELEIQPLLTTNRRGELLALVDDRVVYVLQEDVFTLSHDLNFGSFRANAIAVDAQNNLVVATETSGIIRFDAAGEEVDRIGVVGESSSPQAGEIVDIVGVAASITGAIYWADSNGDYSLITASEVGVESGRIGLTNLTAGVAVEGTLDELVERQIWTFDGDAGEMISLIALADEDRGDLDLALTLLAPDGTELFSELEDITDTLENFTDVRLDAFVLEQSGRYLVLVEREFGIGAYQLGFDRYRSVTLTEDEVTTLIGELSDVFPEQHWVFEGRAGQTLTLTMRAQSGDLDTILMLTNAEGDLIAENDDAEVIDIGSDSQIVQVLLPFTGEYRIEAARFTGVGRYTLTVEVE